MGGGGVNDLKYNCQENGSKQWQKSAISSVRHFGRRQSTRSKGKIDTGDSNLLIYYLFADYCYHSIIFNRTSNKLKKKRRRCFSCLYSMKWGQFSNYVTSVVNMIVADGVVTLIQDSVFPRCTLSIVATFSNSIIFWGKA